LQCSVALCNKPRSKGPKGKGEEGEEGQVSTFLLLVSQRQQKSAQTELKSQVTTGTIGSAICTEQTPRQIKLVGWVSVEMDCGAEEWDGRKKKMLDISII
jgi:hypothetical protein